MALLLCLVDHLVDLTDLIRLFLSRATSLRDATHIRRMGIVLTDRQDVLVAVLVELYSVPVCGR